MNPGNFGWFVPNTLFPFLYKYMEHFFVFFIVVGAATAFLYFFIVVGRQQPSCVALAVFLHGNRS
jgi:hypothetical protein